MFLDRARIISAFITFLSSPHEVEDSRDIARVETPPYECELLPQYQMF